jgi:hypothetical protein
MTYWGTPSDYLIIIEYRLIEPVESARESIIDYIDFLNPLAIPIQ